MSVIAGFARGAYYFFVEDGSVAVGALVALVLIAALAHYRPFGNAGTFAGPLLFALIAALLVANLIRVAQSSRPRR